MAPPTRKAARPRVGPAAAIGAAAKLPEATTRRSAAAGNEIPADEHARQGTSTVTSTRAKSRRVSVQGSPAAASTEPPHAGGAGPELEVGGEWQTGRNKRGRRAAVKAVEETNKSFVCPMSHVLMGDPVVAADGYTYERASIEEWIQREQAGGRTARSPSTNLPLANTSLTPNRTLKSVICEAVDLELGRGKRAREGAEGEGAGEGGAAARPVSRPRRRGR